MVGGQCGAAHLFKAEVLQKSRGQTSHPTSCSFLGEEPPGGARQGSVCRPGDPCKELARSQSLGSSSVWQALVELWLPQGCVWGEHVCPKFEFCELLGWGGGGLLPLWLLLLPRAPCPLSLPLFLALRLTGSPGRTLSRLCSPRTSTLWYGITSGHLLLKF